MKPNYYNTFKRVGRMHQMPETVPIRQMTPLKLRDKVVGSSSRTDENCLFEMSLLFRCWEQNNFGDKPCVEYVNNVNKCHEKLMKNTAIRKEEQKVDVPTPNSKNLTARQITYLLRMYPTV